MKSTSDLAPIPKSNPWRDTGGATRRRRSGVQPETRTTIAKDCRCPRGHCSFSDGAVSEFASTAGTRTATEDGPWTERSYHGSSSADAGVRPKRRPKLRTRWEGDEEQRNKEGGPGQSVPKKQRRRRSLAASSYSNQWGGAARAPRLLDVAEKLLVVSWWLCSMVNEI